MLALPTLEIEHDSLQSSSFKACESLRASRTDSHRCIGSTLFWTRSDMHVRVIRCTHV
jgi:hypothetical protein